MNNKNYTIKQLLDFAWIGNKKYFLIEWDGYPIEDSTWEPLSSLQSIKEECRQFYNNLSAEQQKKRYKSKNCLDKIIPQNIQSKMLLKKLKQQKSKISSKLKGQNQQRICEQSLNPNRQETSELNINSNRSDTIDLIQSQPQSIQNLKDSSTINFNKKSELEVVTQSNQSKNVSEMTQQLNQVIMKKILPKFAPNATSKQKYIIAFDNNWNGNQEIVTNINLIDLQKFELNIDYDEKRTPDEIHHIKSINRPRKNNTTGEIQFLVSWIQNKQGYYLVDNRIKKSVILKKQPLKLLQFYEKKIKWAS